MPKTKICQVCGKAKTRMICDDCVARDVNEINSKLIKKDKEMLEFLEDIYQEANDNRIEFKIRELKQRIQGVGE